MVAWGEKVDMEDGKWGSSNQRMQYANEENYRYVKMPIGSPVEAGACTSTDGSPVTMQDCWSSVGETKKPLVLQEVDEGLEGCA